MSIQRTAASVMAAAMMSVSGSFAVDVAADEQATLFCEQRSRLERCWTSLPDKPDESPDLTVRALWLAAAGTPRALHALGASLPVLDVAGVARLRDLVSRRMTGVPLAYLTGRQSFLRLELLSGPEALIPRRETELLASTAVRVALNRVGERGSATLLDVCTGSGNVALATAAHVPEARVLAADLCPKAVRLARQNAAHLALAERVTFADGDLFTPFDRPELHRSVDVVTCNPPYLPSSRVAAMPAEIAQHEPRLAFDGGALGVKIVLRVIAEAPRFLKPASQLLIEVGRGQADFVAERMRRHGAYSVVTLVRDPEREARVVMGTTRRDLAPEVAA